MFTATEAGGPKIVEEARNRVVLEFGFGTPMVLRDARAWRALNEGKPFIRSGADPDALHALCLSAEPSPTALARLDPSPLPANMFRICGRNVYLRLPQAWPGPS
jgi:uncharacterized protein (DUF1697 family)